MFKSLFFRLLTTAIVLISACRTVAAGDFLLSAPPVESPEYSKQLYDPIAAYLSEVTGESVTYTHPGNWPNYILKMQQARYDFVIDAPHFVSWRIENLEYSVLAMLAPNLKFSVVSLDSGDISKLADLRGGVVCSSSIPDLDAISLLDQFDSVWTLPKIVSPGGYEAIFDSFKKGMCGAVVLPQRVFRRLSAHTGSAQVRVLFESHELPHFGLSSSPRVSPEIADRIQNALDSSRGRDAMSGLLEYFGLSEIDIITPVDTEIYQGYAYLLDDYWGF